jgi:hypothetical protein
MEATRARHRTGDVAGGELRDFTALPPGAAGVLAHDLCDRFASFFTHGRPFYG